MKTGLLCTVSFCAVSVGFVAWRVNAVQNREIRHFAVVEDPSHVGGCDSLLGLAEQVLQAKDASSGSTLTLLVLGDRTTASEPWRMGMYSIPTIRRVLEGRSAKLRREKEILADISAKCQSLRRTTISPIFMGVTQGVADLRAHGCKPISRCRLFVDSDLEENVDSTLRARLNGNEGQKSISQPRIDNSGIDVAFCGVAVTHGRIHDSAENGGRKFLTRDSNRETRIQEVWRSLFTKPAAVRFEPYCPNSAQFGTRLAPDAGRFVE